MGRLQQKIAASVRVPDLRQLSSAEASTSGRLTRCHRSANGAFTKLQIICLLLAAAVVFLNTYLVRYDLQAFGDSPCSHSR